MRGLVTESIEDINKLLQEHYGIDTLNGLPIWRVIWANDQLEKIRGTFEDYTESGIYLRTVTEVREVKKYPFEEDKDKYILERLVVVPEINQGELVDSNLPNSKLSYEPMHVFMDNQGRPLPPKFRACKLVVDTVYAALGKKSLAGYMKPEDKDPRLKDLRADGNNGMTAWRKRIDDIELELFGESSGLKNAIVLGEGVSMHGPRLVDKD